MPDESDPPRKVYGFKERDFKRDNAPTTAAGPAPTAQDLAKLAGPVTPSVPKSPSGAKAGDPNDVYVALEKNRKSAEKHGLNEVQLREIKSRRKRDYWLLLIGGNLAILAGVALSGFNLISAIFGLAGLILFSLSATWIMWQVMDKY